MTDIFEQYSIISTFAKYLAIGDLCQFVLVNHCFCDVGQKILNQQTLSKWEKMYVFMESKYSNGAFISDKYSYFIHRFGIFVFYQSTINVLKIYIKSIFGTNYYHYVTIDIQLGEIVELFSNCHLIPAIFSQRAKIACILQLKCHNCIVYIDFDVETNLINHIKPEYHIIEPSFDYGTTNRFQNLFLPEKVSFSFLRDLKRNMKLSIKNCREVPFIHSQSDVHFEEECDYFFITNNRALICFRNFEKSLILKFSDILGEEPDNFFYLGNDFILLTTTKDTMFFYRFDKNALEFQLVKSVKSDYSDCVCCGIWIHKLKFCLSILDNDYVERYLLIDLKDDVTFNEVYELQGKISFSFEKECFIYDKIEKLFRFYCVTLDKSLIDVQSIKLN